MSDVKNITVTLNFSEGGGDSSENKTSQFDTISHYYTEGALSLPAINEMQRVTEERVASYFDHLRLMRGVK